MKPHDKQLPRGHSRKTEAFRSFDLEFPRMNFIELDRDFIALDAERAYNAEVLAAFKGFTWRGLKWPDLLSLDRVVVLAEASTGKTAEFRHRAELLRQEGGFGIYLPIERLERNGLEGSLGRDERDALEKWRRGADPGWFFLDSIDEARIHHKDIEQAFKRLEVELGESYHRARVLLSCRGTAWAGEADISLIKSTLPMRPKPANETAEPVDPEEALLSKPERASDPSSKPDEPKPELKLVALARIDRQQRAAFLSAEGVADADRFEEALFLHGLIELAARPGDLKNMVRFWKSRGDFGDLTEMVEFGIRERLAESNPNRRAVITLSAAEAREGTERLAAALTLAQTMDLLLPDIAGAEVGGVDPYQVLEDWNPNDVDELLHRGMFVPSSFGQIRFHHRSAQEYLTACWFERLGLPDAELYRILLGEAFGVATVPPSLRAAAAWVSGWHEGLRSQIKEREPQLLISEGDPRRLPLSDRSELLLNFAERQLAGDNSYRLIDHRSLWMFADEALAPAIHQVLAINPRADFRFEMLRLIEQGRIVGCKDILIETALDRSASDYHRVVAAQALAELQDDEALKRVANDVLAGPTPSAYLGPAMALALFPKALSVDQLLDLIGKSKPARRYQVEGFRDELFIFYERCGSDAERLKLIGGLAKLAFASPLEDWPKLSKRNATLVGYFVPTAREAIRAARRTGITPELLNFLRAAQRASDEFREGGPALAELVRSWPELNEALFWAEAEAQEREKGTPVTYWRDVTTDGPSLWSIGDADRQWLDKALCSDQAHRRLLALDALIAHAFGSEDAQSALTVLRDRVLSDPELVARVTQAMTPREPTERDVQRDAKWEALARAREQREEEFRQHWRRVRGDVQAAPEKLCDAGQLRRWPGVRPLLQLTQWLAERVNNGLSAAALHSPQLERAYGAAVADAYRKGLKTLWRVTRPQRPKEGAEGRRTVKYSVILSMAGLSLEASEDPNWATLLSPEEAERAALHVVLDDQAVPEWLSQLLAAHSAVVAPIVAKSMIHEWQSTSNFTPFLERAARSLAPLEQLKPILMKLLMGSEPSMIERIATAGDLLLRLELSADERRSLAKLAQRRLRKARTAAETERMMAHLRMLFRADADLAASELVTIIEAALSEGDFDKVESLLRTSFHRHRERAIDPARLSAATLQRLLEISYLVRSCSQSNKQSAASATTDDISDEEEQLSDAFDDPRNELLSALIAVGGEPAYGAMISLANNLVVGESSHRLKELARQIAEQSAERPPWTPSKVRLFEQKKLAPITTGEDLLGLACDLLDKIDWDFQNADMSARSIVEPAKSEKQVQEWLGSTLNTIGLERFRAHREAVVAGDNRPDLILGATSAPVEVAIEIKHADKKWSVTDLVEALHGQLAGQYLLPANRRHGLLVITNHRSARYWRDTAGGERISFGELIAMLQAEAAAIAANSAGPIKVEVRGLDAARRPSQRRATKS